MKTIIVLVLPLLSFVPFVSIPTLHLGARTPPFVPAIPTWHSISSPMAPVDEDRRAPSPFTERAIRERAKKWELKHLETPRWRLLMTDTFAIRSDLPPEEIRAAGVYLEEFLKAHKKSLGGDPSDLRFSVHIFRDEEEFRCYAKVRGVPNADSFYDPRGSEVVVHFDPLFGREALVLALMHEFSHQYLDRVFHRTSPIWLAEGLAEYFRRYSVVNGAVRPGGEDEAHHKRLREARENGTFISLSKLVSMNREEFYDENIMLRYAEAWSFVSFLISSRRDAVEGLLRGQALDTLVNLVEVEGAWMKLLEK